MAKWTPPSSDMLVDDLEEESAKKWTPPSSDALATEDDTTDLPEPTSNMYEGKSFEEAKAIFDKYKSAKESSENFLGEISFKNKIVPEPSRKYKLGKSTPSNPRGSFTETDESYLDPKYILTGAARNAAKNVAKTGAAVIDTVRDNLPGFLGGTVAGQPDPNLTGAVEENISEMEFKEKYETAADITQGILGLVGGAAVAGPVGGFLGGVTTMEEDTQGTFIGNEEAGAMLQLYKGLENVSEDEAKEVLTRRVNIAMDAMLTAGVIKGGTKAVSAVGDALWNMTVGKVAGSYRTTSIEERAVTEFLENVYKVDKITDAKQYAEEFNKLAESARKNKDILIKVGDNLNQSGVDDISIKRDTFGALIEGTDDPSALNRLAGARKGFKSTEVNELADQSSHALKKFTGQVDELKGGTSAINKSAGELVESGMKEVQGYADEVTRIEDAINKSDTDLTQLIQSDPRIADAVNDIRSKQGFGIFDFKRNTQDKIIKTVKDTFKKLREGREEVYKALPDYPVDMTEVADTVTSMPSENYKYLPSTLKSKFEVADGSIKLKEGADLNVNLKDFYSDYKRSVSTEINKRLKDPSSPSSLVDDLRRLDDSMKVSIDGVKQQFPDAQKAFDAIDDYEINTYYRLRDEGPIQGLSDAYKRSVAIEVGPNARPKNELTFNQKVVDTLEGNIKESKRFETEKFIDLLQQSNDPEASRLLVDLTLGDTIADLSATIKSGKSLSSVNTETFSKKLLELSNIMEDVDPAQAQRISGFIDSMANAKNQKEFLTKELLPAAEEAASSAKARILDGELAAFVKKQGDLRLPINDTGFISFNEVFGAPDSIATVKQLVDRAEATGNPEVLEGVQSAFARFMGNKFTEAGASVDGIGKFNLKAFKNLSSGIDPTLEYAKVIYKNNPEFVDVVKQLVDVGGTTESLKRVGSNTMANTGGEEANIRQVMDFFNTQIFGPLDRTGSRVRSAASRVISFLDPTQKSRRIAEEIFQNPEYFADIAERIAAKSVNNREAKKAIFDLAVRSYIYTDEEEDTFNKDYDAWLKSRRAELVDSSSSTTRRENTTKVDKEMKDLQLTK